MKRAATKADRARWDMFRRFGCIVSAIYFGRFDQYDVHHLVEGYRLGHRFTIPLNPWYHRGQPPDDMSNAEAEAIYGPSMKLSKDDFVKRFGTERELLAKTDEMIDGIRNGV